MSNRDARDEIKTKDRTLNRRNILLGGTTLAAASAPTSRTSAQVAQAQQEPARSERKPNILVIFGDDIGQTNVSAYSFGLMGYRTPNIDRIAREGMMFTDYYAEQSCTAGRDRRRNVGRRHRFHATSGPGEHAVLLLVQFHPHALPYACAGIPS